MLQSYLNTYVERDLRFIENVRDLGEFKRFISLLAAMTAQETNESQIGRENGLSHTTAKRWISLFQASFQWLEVPAYWGNSIKRISKKRKGYLGDTGLISLLLKLSSPETIGSSTHFRSLFESYVLQQIVAISSSLSLAPTLYHWRSKKGAEVDLVIEINEKLVPIEIKGRTYITKADLRGIHAFRESYPNRKIETGVIIYAGERCYI